MTLLERRANTGRFEDAALVVQFEIGDALDSIDAGSQRTIEERVHPTIVNVLRMAVAGIAFKGGAEKTGIERLVVVGVGWDQTICRVEIATTYAETIDWAVYEPGDLLDDAVVYYSTADGWHQGIEDRYEAYARAISDSGDFAGLLAAIARYGPVQGSSREFSTGELSHVVRSFRDLASAEVPVDEVEFTRMTRTLGLRAKCKHLYTEHTESE